MNAESALAYLASDWRMGVSGGIVMLIMRGKFVQERSSVRGKEM